MSDKDSNSAPTNAAEQASPAAAVAGNGSGLQASDLSAKPPRSPEQVAASRKNGKCSNGPTSPEGKARSAQNSYKHGLCAQHLFRPGEQHAADVQAYKLLVTRIYACYQAVGFMEEFYVEKIVIEMVRLSRPIQHEQKFVASPGCFNDQPIDRILRYQASINKQLTDTGDTGARTSSGKAQSRDEFRRGRSC